MSNAFLLLASYVVNAVWQVAILGAAGWGLSRWVKPTGPELQHKIWVTTLMLATFVPATPLIQSYFVHETLRGEVSASSHAIVDALTGRHVSLMGSDLIFQPFAICLVSGLYIAALLFSFLRLWWMVHRTAALVRNAVPASTEPDYAALWHRSKERFSVQSAALLRSRDVSGPVTAGLWRPVLLLPATFTENHSRTEFLAAVAHECAHIKRNDFGKNVFYEIVGLFTAFHPVTWFIKSQIAQTREMLCDQIAAEQLLDRRAYALSLLQLASKMPSPATSLASHAMGMFDTKILERRIMTLTTSLPRVSRFQRYLWTVTAILLLSICASVIGSMTQTVAAQTANSSAQAGSAGNKQEGSKDLSCTYYNKGGRGQPGTCGFDKEDKTKYRCYSNEDPARSNPQIACEWKVRRAQESQK
jgi:beta-lactamase regulating signal transducer with metallopeptidase domain